MTFEINELTKRQIKRLRWTAERGKAVLLSRYNKLSRSALTFDERVDFLRYLESLSE